MAIQIIENFSTGFGMNAALVSNWATLSEYKAGKIHLFNETLMRFAIVEDSLTFTRMVLKKLAYTRIADQLQASPIKWAIRLTPIAIGFLKYQTQKTYPLLAKRLSYLENWMEKSAYATFVVGSIALVRFGHLLAGYSGLSVLLFNQIINNDFAKSHIPLLDKVDSVFNTYIIPIIGLITVAACGSYLTIGCSLFSLALMAHASLTTTTCQIQENQKDLKSPLSSKLTLDKWKKINTDRDAIFVKINQERIPKIIFPSLNENIDTKQSILDILTSLPEHLQKKLIDRINNTPVETKIQTFEEAKFITEKYADKLILFTKQRPDSIWNALLQQSCLLLQQLNNDPNQQLVGMIELLFGNEGQCQVAQQRNILSGFLVLSKMSHTTTNELDLKFNLALENLYSENFRSFLQAMQNQASLRKTQNFLQKKANESNYFLRPFIKITLLFHQTLRSWIDLTDMHQYQIHEKLYGPHFGIQPIAKDLVAETANIVMMENPFWYLLTKCVFKLNTIKSSPVYFETQLQKIVPWLSNQIMINQFFHPNEITLWFSHWIEKQDLPEEEIMDLQEELASLGTIAGHPIYHIESNQIEPIALIAFLYGMDVFTDSLEEKASIQDLLENLEPTFDLLLRDFEKKINDLDHIPIENPFRAKTLLLDYLLSSEEFSEDQKKLFISSLFSKKSSLFSKKCALSSEEQTHLKEVWSQKAVTLKEEFEKLPLEATKINLGKQLYNLMDLKNLNLNPEILFV